MSSRSFWRNEADKIRNDRSAVDTSGLFANPWEEEEYDPVKKAKRIKQEIEKLRKKYPNKSTMDLQNMVAEQNQNSNWYRGGNTASDGTAKLRSGSTGQRLETKIIWKIYDYMPKDVFSISGSRDKYAINTWHEINLDPKDNYVLGSAQGLLVVFFDDRTVPDKFTLREKNGTVLVSKDYGTEQNMDDNTVNVKKELTELKSFKLEFMVEHPVQNTSFGITNYDLTIGTENAIVELKEPKFEYFISNEQLLNGR